MTTLVNPFELLGSDGVEDLSLLVKALPLKDSEPKKEGQPATAQAKLPSKPLPPSQAVREAKNEGGRGGYPRGYGNGEKSYGNGEAGKTSERRSYGGPHGHGFSNEDAGNGERSRRPFERRSGTGRGSEVKREGSGRGNWGTHEDEITQGSEVLNESEKNLSDEKPAGEENVSDSKKEIPAAEAEEKAPKPEDKSMTLDEYEKVLEEKRKALQALKNEERKVDAKEFESMQQLSSKKGLDEDFIKLGSEKDKKKEAYEKEERAKKSVSINEFLKPAEGERYYSPGGRGRGRGRGRGDRATENAAPAPRIEDTQHFPTLGGK